VRERIRHVDLLNNFSMAIELKVMPISTEKYRSTDISGDYAAMARAFGGTASGDQLKDIIPAISAASKTKERASGAAGIHHPGRPRFAAGDRALTQLDF
jgi:acetolactate synthase-1/2/3 large subunit